jgi:hypothetical protein
MLESRNTEQGIWRYPDFYDARLNLAEFVLTDDNEPTVVFQYHLLGGDNNRIIGEVKKVYQLCNRQDATHLAVDLRRLGYELPYEGEELPAVIADLDRETPLVQVMVHNSGDSGTVHVEHVKRYG